MRNLPEIPLQNRFTCTGQRIHAVFPSATLRANLISYLKHCEGVSQCIGAE